MACNWWEGIQSVSMPSRAYTSFLLVDFAPLPLMVTMCQCPLGLIPHFYDHSIVEYYILHHVSMPSRAWVVTVRMSNILNFPWYFLCIPAIYKCILAYLPIFFNQLSKFLRCESPSTFLGTCLSHHSFIIFLVTNTNTLLSGLYLISTKALEFFIDSNGNGVSMPSRAYTSFLQLLTLSKSFKNR